MKHAVADARRVLELDCAAWDLGRYTPDWGKSMELTLGVWL